MKNMIAISLLVLPYLASAQFEKGQLYLGGTLSASAATTAYNNPAGNNQINNQYSATPSIGFFLNPKVSIGTGIGYSVAYQEYGNTKYHGHYFFFNPFARYYIPVTGSFFIALQGQINASRGSTIEFIQQSGIIGSVPSYNVGATISPIFIFFPSPKWGIEAAIGSIGYNYTRMLPDVSSTGTFSLNSGTFSLGVAYYFKRKG